MARRMPPVLIGGLKHDNKAFEGFVVTVWRLPSGETRLVAQKAVHVADLKGDGAKLVQQVLVDVQGNPI